MDIQSAITKLIILWGKLFRFIFIAALGVWAYFWFNPTSLMDFRLSDITPRMLVNNILGAGIPVGCVYWFVNFPDIPEDESNPTHPYREWANYSIVFIAIIILIAYFA